MSWYEIKNIDALDSPALVVYPERVKRNIAELLRSIDNVSRLRPHIKTHKSLEVSRLMLEAGIRKFKCATIAEAEMLAMAGAKDILLAYQPVGPKAFRLSSLATEFPDIAWACLIDNENSARFLGKIFEASEQVARVYIDLNVGMNRTGIDPAKALALVESLQHIKGLTIIGLHAYDGHLRDTDYDARKKRCDEAFAMTTDLQSQIEKKFGKRLIIVAGGTPTFSIHAKRQDVECSPGTFIYWDKGYEAILQEQHYEHAALVISRVISLPSENIICTDLGHKAIASENPLANRVFFLNAPELEPIGHSEEHMVFKTQKKYAVGDVLYGVPFHVCPTVALHDLANVVIDGKFTETWVNSSRKRKLTI